MEKALLVKPIFPYIYNYVYIVVHIFKGAALRIFNMIKYPILDILCNIQEMIFFPASMSNAAGLLFMGSLCSLRRAVRDILHLLFARFVEMAL